MTPALKIENKKINNLQLNQCPFISHALLNGYSFSQKSRSKFTHKLLIQCMSAAADGPTDNT